MVKSQEEHSKPYAVRDWTFTHWWVRPTVKIWFWIYHRHVTYSGENNVDWEKPIIFIPTHQNAFSDALCLILPAKYTDNRFIYPLIRADAYGNNRAIDWILSAFHMIPVYRPRDGVDLRKKNEEIFGICYDLLRKKRNLLIHPEGNCIPRKQVRRFKKGTARIAFGAEEAHGYSLDVHLVPVGINYRNITEPRSGIHIRYGEPVRVLEYADAYKENPPGAISALTLDLERAVKSVAVNIPVREAYGRLDKALKLLAVNDGFYSGHGPFTESELAYKKDKLLNFENGKGEFDELESITGEIDALIEGSGISAEFPLNDTSVNYLKAAGLILLLPAIIYGWVNNLIPWKLMNKITDSYIKQDQFKSSVRMTVGLLIFPLCYLMQSGAVWSISGSWLWALLYLASLPLTGRVAWYGREHWSELRHSISLKRAEPRIRQRLDELLSRLRGMFRGSGKKEGSVSDAAEPEKL